MTPKEKAEELVDKYRMTIISYLNDRMKHQNSINCALIAVDEILNIVDTIYDYDRNVLYPYWQEVKQEIEKL